MLPLEVWRTTGVECPSVNRNGNDSKLYSLEGPFWPAHFIAMHPYFVTYSVTRWTSPAAGNYYIIAIFSVGHGLGTTTDVHVIKNGSTAGRIELFNGYIDAISNGDDDREIYVTGPISLSSGETLDFIVGMGSDNHGSDTTLVDVALANDVAGYWDIYWETQVIDIDIDIPGHLFYSTDTATAKISVNPPLMSTTMEVTAQLYNPDDDLVGILGPVYLNAGNSYSATLGLQEDMGYYSMVVKVEELGNPIHYSEKSTCYAVIPANNALNEKEPDSPFGINDHFGSVDENLVKRLGVGWVKNQGGIDDINDIHNANLCLIYEFPYCPYRYDTIINQLTPSEPGGTWPNSWDFSIDADWYEQLVIDYGDKINVYDLVGEPGNPGQWPEWLGGSYPEGPWLEVLTEYHRQVIAEMRKADPDVKVLWKESDQFYWYDDYLNYLTDDESNGLVFALAPHPYKFNPTASFLPEDQGIMNNIPSFWEIVDTNNLPWHLWIAECGFSTPPYSLKQQAAAVVRFTIVNLFNGAEKIIWHNFRNIGDNPYIDGYGYGMMTAYETPKPSGVAYANLIHRLKGYTRFAKCYISGGDDIFAYAWKQPSSGRLTMLAWRKTWDPATSHTLTIISDITQVTVKDIYGVSTTVPVSGHELVVELGPSPIYIDGLQEEDIAFYIGGYTEYDVEKDFSIVNGNPNGTWSYGKISGSYNSPYSFSNFNSNETEIIDGKTLEIWRDSVIVDPGVHHNNNAAAINAPWGGVWPAYSCTAHPAPNGAIWAGYRWTASESGVYDISVTFSVGHPGFTTTDVHVIRNGSQASHQVLFNGNVNAGSTDIQTFSLASA